MSPQPDLSNYNEVADRIAEFREKFPEGALRPFREPYTINIGEQHYIVYAAGAWRNATDEAPAGVGYAWEPVPGLTSFTKHSELMNAETSAWGRALVAALATSAKKIASREEVQNRQVESSVPPTEEGGEVKTVPRPSPKPSTTVKPKTAESSSGGGEESPSPGHIPASGPAGSNAQAGGRVYLDVPYADKDEAKAAGARWDGRAPREDGKPGRWYVPVSADPFPLLKWLPKSELDDEEIPF